jgi:hypothetical protein
MTVVQGFGPGPVYSYTKIQTDGNSALCGRFLNHCLLEFLVMRMAPMLRVIRDAQRELLCTPLPLTAAQVRFVQSPAFTRSADWARLRYDFMRDHEGRCECCGQGARPRQGQRRSHPSAQDASTIRFVLREPAGAVQLLQPRQGQSRSHRLALPPRPGRAELSRLPGADAAPIKPWRRFLGLPGNLRGMAVS